MMSHSLHSTELWCWQIAWEALQVSMPEEGDLLEEVLETHYSHIRPIGDTPMGYGSAELASAALIVFQTVFEAVRSVMPSLGSAALDIAKEGIKAKVLERVKTPPAQASIQLDAKQLTAIRSTIVAKALRSQYTRFQAEGLADAVVAALAISRG